MTRSMKPALVVVAAIAMFLVSSPAMATTISFTLPEFNGNGIVDIGSTFTFGSVTYTIPAGEAVISAIFSSTFGNSTIPNTAIMEVFVDSVLVGQCASILDPCWTKPTQPPTSFSHIFTPGELADLVDEAALLQVHQTDIDTIRLGVSSLTIETGPSDLTPTPEPASLALMAVGLTGAVSAAWRRRRSRPDA